MYKSKTYDLTDIPSAHTGQVGESCSDNSTAFDVLESNYCGGLDVQSQWGLELIPKGVP